MSRFFAKACHAIIISLIVIAVFPLIVLAVLAIAAVRLFRFTELHAVYGGDKGKRMRDEYCDGYHKI